MKNILTYLLNSYNLKAIILHGSRASSGFYNDSDYDLILLSEKRQNIKPHTFNGYNLDIDELDASRNWNDDPYEHIWPIKVLFEDRDQKGLNFYKCMQTQHDKGPIHLTSQDWEDRLNFINRLHIRLTNRGNQPLLRYYYLSKIYERAIRYWFEKRNQWTLSAHHAIEHITKEDPEYINTLLQLWSDDYIIAVYKIKKNIFEIKE